jgi:hypothetical protein
MGARHIARRPGPAGYWGWRYDLKWPATMPAMAMVGAPCVAMETGSADADRGHGDRGDNQADDLQPVPPLVER